MNRARITSTRPTGPAPHRRKSAAAPWLALALVFLAVPGCGRHASVGPPGETGELPDQEVGDFVLTETEQGTPVWKMFARSAATYSARNLVIARGVRIDFYDEKGVQSSELTAREGEMQQQTRNMIARGDVVLQTTEGTRMSTQEIRFLNKEQKIVSPIEQEVRVERHGDVLTGFGFESDPDLKHFEFKRRVQATVRTQSGGTLLERGGDRH